MPAGVSPLLVLRTTPGLLDWSFLSSTIPRQDDLSFLTSDSLPAIPDNGPTQCASFADKLVMHEQVNFSVNTTATDAASFKIPEFKLPELKLPEQVFQHQSNFQHHPMRWLSVSESGYVSEFHASWPDAGPADGMHEPLSSRPSPTEFGYRANVGDYVSELAQAIDSRLGAFVAARELVKSRHVFPDMIKAFSIKLGLESASQTNQDIMYFVHK